MAEKRYGETPYPAASDVYVASLMASGLAYAGIMLLIATGILFDGTSIRAAAAVYFFGLIASAVPAMLVAFLVAAPVGTATGVLLHRFVPPSRWHGALNGWVTTLFLLVLFSWLTGSGWPNAAAWPVFACILAIGTASGCYAQRKVLRWPESELST